MNGKLQSLYCLIRMKTLTALFLLGLTAASAVYVEVPDDFSKERIPDNVLEGENLDRLADNFDNEAESPYTFTDERIFPLKERSDNNAKRFVPKKSLYRPESHRVEIEKESKCPKQLLKPSCMPRLRMISLEVHSPSYYIIPNMVEVFRCDGPCNSGGQSCVPTKTSQVKIMVMQEPRIKKKKNTCGTITVEQHDACECGCAVTKSDCLENQYYKDCRCICEDEGAQRRCEMMNRYWDQQTCECKCSVVIVCSTGEMFEHETCTCRPYMMLM